MAARNISLKDTIRIEGDLIDYAHRLAEKHGRWDIPETVEVSPPPTGLAALMFVPFVGLLISLVVWRWVRGETKKERERAQRDC